MSKEQIANLVMSRITILTQEEINTHFAYFTEEEKKQLAQITLIDIINAVKVNPEYFRKMKDQYDIIYHAWVIKSIEKSREDIKNGRCMTLEESEKEMEAWINEHYNKQ